MIVGYADVVSAEPGDTVKIMVSCSSTGDDSGAVTADLVKLIRGDGGSDGDPLQERWVAHAGSFVGREQPIHRGSYATVSNLEPLRSFTVQAFVYPTLLGGSALQVVLGNWSASDDQGFALCIDEQGCFCLQMGIADERFQLNTGKPLVERRWYLAAASYDTETGVAGVWHQPVQLGIAELESILPGEGQATWPAGSSWDARTFGIAAAPGCPATHHFNGKVDRARLSSRLLERTEVEALMAYRPDGPLRASLLASWDGSIGVDSDQLHDSSGHERHGHLHQLPLRAVTGHNWDGTEQRFRDAPHQYGAVHFRHDDLYDAGWTPDLAFAVPRDIPSGIYAVRLSCGSLERHIPIVVRPRRPSAALALLLPTATYWAYGNVRNLSKRALDAGREIADADERYLLDHPEFGDSLYDHSDDGTGVHFASRLRPVLNFSPRGPVWGLNADLNIVGFLEHDGIAYDVITDDDLHEHGMELLEPYEAVLTGTHPEYYSTPMYDALEQYLSQGGRLLYLGGNGFYWRVAYHRDKPGVIEVRRAEDGTRSWASEAGEYYHQLTGEYGGLWRRLGRSPNRLVGVGFTAMAFDRSGYYRRLPAAKDQRAAFLFDGVQDEIIGDFGSIGAGAAGEEIDRFDLAFGSPTHALVVATSEGHTAMSVRANEDILIATPNFRDSAIRADLTFMETAAAGAVFSTSSITWGASLAYNSYDNSVAQMTRNAIRRFTDPSPFPPPPEAVRLTVPSMSLAMAKTASEAEAAVMALRAAGHKWPHELEEVPETKPRPRMPGAEDVPSLT
jgi:N,N-dimethylformamidase beta subunit-like protein/concanavalin A-like lectin/glucanase superfamily protein